MKSRDTYIIMHTNFPDNLSMSLQFCKILFKNPKLSAIEGRNLPKKFVSQIFMYMIVRVAEGQFISCIIGLNLTCFHYIKRNFVVEFIIPVLVVFFHSRGLM